MTLDQVNTSIIRRLRPSLGKHPSLHANAPIRTPPRGYSAGGAQPLHFHPSGPYQLFVESGDCRAHPRQGGRGGTGALLAGRCCRCQHSPCTAWRARTARSTTFWTAQRRRTATSPARDAGGRDGNRFGSVFGEARGLGEPTTDIREKYWGRIETFSAAISRASAFWFERAARAASNFTSRNARPTTSTAA